MAKYIDWQTIKRPQEVALDRLNNEAIANFSALRGLPIDFMMVAIAIEMLVYMAANP